MKDALRQNSLVEATCSLTQCTQEPYICTCPLEAEESSRIDRELIRPASGLGSARCVLAWTASQPSPAQPSQPIGAGNALSLICWGSLLFSEQWRLPQPSVAWAAPRDETGCCWVYWKRQQEPWRRACQTGLRALFQMISRVVTEDAFYKTTGKKWLHDSYDGIIWPHSSGDLKMGGRVV